MFFKGQFVLISKQLFLLINTRKSNDHKLVNRLPIKSHQAYDNKVREDDETLQTYADFVIKRNALGNTYSLLRKKAKVIYRNDLQTMKKLILDGSIR